MVMLDFDRIRRAATAMSDEELSEALASRREDYVPEALEVMSAELERRGVNPREHVPPKEAARVSLPWLTGYVSISGLGALLAVVSTPLSLGSVAISGFLAAVAFHLNKRAGWAWWATMLVLGILTLRSVGLASQSIVGALLGLLWGIGNGIYFYRARQHFTA